MSFLYKLSLSFKKILLFVFHNINPVHNTPWFYLFTLYKILYKKQRPDLLVKTDIKVLLKPAEEYTTYFDYILDCIKENKLKASIQPFTYYIKTIDDYVKYYLIIAKHDMMEYVKELEVKDLLKKYDDVTLLNGLLNADSDLTLNKILTKSAKSDPKIKRIRTGKCQYFFRKE